jgi:hypothetical protein
MTGDWQYLYFTTYSDDTAWYVINLSGGGTFQFMSGNVIEVH